MRSGRLNHRIALQSRATTVGASGTPTGGWSQVLSMRASVEVLEAKEGYEGAQNTARLTHEVIIRYRSTVESGMRVVWEGRVLEIHGVIPDAKRTMLKLKCEERA